MINNLLAHPLTRRLSPDDPRTTLLRRRIIQEKPFLRQLYEEWYAVLLDALPDAATCPGKVLELGAGGGFFRDICPEAVTSEIFPITGIDLVADATALPFAAASLRGIVMVNVLHHIPDAKRFLREAARVLTPGGVVAMLEPWHTPLSRRIYQHVHPEPFDPDVTEWSFSSSGHLSGANGALPWIMFERDRDIFERDFPKLAVERITLDYPCSYILSGGVSMRSFLPGCCFPPVRAIEHFLSFGMKHLAMFSFIILRRVCNAGE